jgi:tetratricopeptide (TPR) repeat protein
VDGSDFCAHAEAYAFLSEACLGQGKLQEALDAAQRALNLAGESENDLDLGIAWRTLGQVLAARNHSTGSAPVQRSNGRSLVAPKSHSEPDACFFESHQIFKKIKAEGEAARTLRLWGNFDLENGRAREGNQKLHEAETIFRQLGGIASSAAFTEEPTGAVE